ncbi:uncharacterized protein LOC117609781 [Osmia lignaria lignaria]|uniref:uncharacterized protein LOC117609781 n=1 Tax=Osmia lignaria lignaria TaxID=1437193 RepID=UPI00402B937F
MKIDAAVVFEEKYNVPLKSFGKTVKDDSQTDMSDKNPSFLPNNVKDVGRILSENALCENNDVGRILSENALRKNDETVVVQCECTSERLTVQNVLDNSDDNFVVGVGHFDVGRISDNVPEGRRVVDVHFFWNEIHRTFDNHARGIECHFRDWKMIGSRQHGCLTQFFFKCQMCNYEDTVWSEPMHSDITNVNEAMTTATVTVGIGSAQLEELCAALNMPCMAETTYRRYREKLVDEFMKSAMHTMQAAGEEERRLAYENNEVVDGIPYITVIADGSWMKRSYGTNYNSLSGVGAILGFRTGKVLFIGIRNKYCTICDIAERKAKSPKHHKCYKNYDRYASSSSMESDAIAEGFNCSIQMHGLIYRTVVADGDSNVYHTIVNNRPYREQKVTVRKVECTNHLLRNLCKKLRYVAEKTQTKGQRARGYVAYRNIIKKNILNIRRAVVLAVNARKQEKGPQHIKARELQKDILSIPSHIFGEHKECNSRNHTCMPDVNRAEKNYVPSLKLFGLYSEVEKAIRFLSCYSDSLLMNVTNNPAETFNSIICKEIGGKRINFGARGSYNARVAGAVTQYNTQQVLTEMHKNMCKTVPPLVKRLEERRQKKVAKTKQFRMTYGKTRKLKPVQGTDKYYGPNSQRPDLPSDMLLQLRKEHFQKLADNAKNRTIIETNTREQNDSDLWRTLKEEMLTASNFGAVCRMRQTTSCAAMVKNILYPPFVDTAAMKYGRDKEHIARKDVANAMKTRIRTCGLFIDRDIPYLGASPDGLIDDDGLLELKCPQSAENLTATDAIETIRHLRNIFDKRDIQEMNRKHQYFYQVQGQLHITQRKYCIFAIWTPQSIHMIHVNRDDAFWTNHMEPFLTRFYEECMLPEILDSRHNRHMPIRNPEYILRAKEDASIQKSSRKITKKRTYENMIQNSVEASNMTVEAVNSECVIVSHSDQEEKFIDDDVGYYILETAVSSVTDVQKNVLPVQSKLNDELLDRFLRVVRETAPFETQSVLYLQFTKFIKPCCSDKSVQIIGGNCSDHWRSIYFDGRKLHVYDSLPGSAYDKLVEEEKKYIALRFPHIRKNDILFERVQAQPDCYSCGVYAAAYITTIILGGNPCSENYSHDIQRLRCHFVNIIENNRLSPFPTE